MARDERKFNSPRFTKTRRFFFYSKKARDSPYEQQIKKPPKNVPKKCFIPLDTNKNEILKVTEYYGCVSCLTRIHAYTHAHTQFNLSHHHHHNHDHHHHRCHYHYHHHYSVLFDHEPDDM